MKYLTVTKTCLIWVSVNFRSAHNACMSDEQRTHCYARNVFGVSSWILVDFNLSHITRLLTWMRLFFVHFYRKTQYKTCLTHWYCLMRLMHISTTFHWFCPGHEHSHRIKFNHKMWHICWVYSECVWDAVRSFCRHMLSLCWYWAQKSLVWACTDNMQFW